jgi:hypothetical protein
MERIKLAIEKARDSADQLRAGHPDGKVHEPSPLFKSATAFDAGLQAGGPEGPVQAKPRGVWWPTLLLLGGFSVGAAWFLTGFGAGTEPSHPSAGTSASAAPAPSAAVALPPQPAALVQPGATDGSSSASVVPPSVVVGAVAPAAASASSEAEVAAAVEAWRSAWAARDMVSYLDAYSRAFVPSGGVSRQDWVASRYRNVGGRSSIEVVVRNVEIEALTEDSARVSFLQDYVSGAFRDLDQPKTLDLAREDTGRWRIVRELQGAAPPAR